MLFGVRSVKKIMKKVMQKVMENRSIQCCLMFCKFVWKVEFENPKIQISVLFKELKYATVDRGSAAVAGPLEDPFDLDLLA